MRRKVNCMDVIRWENSHINTCSICDEKAEYHLRYNTFFAYGRRDLCKKHSQEWEKGDLYL
jgi:hypothetical protein